MMGLWEHKRVGAGEENEGERGEERWAGSRYFMSKWLPVIISLWLNTIYCEGGRDGFRGWRESKIERANKRKKQEEKRNGVCVSVRTRVCLCGMVGSVPPIFHWRWQEIRWSAECATNLQPASLQTALSVLPCYWAHTHTQTHTQMLFTHAHKETRKLTT